MKISVISFTEQGERLSERIKRQITEHEVALFTKCSALFMKKVEARKIEIPLGIWTEEQMKEKNAVVFIGACGIAIRAIAPYISNKLLDSPVIVIDENGRYVIPVLSGHIGGANELAIVLAEKLGAEPVITTATDIQQKFAVDLFAKKNHLHIKNQEGIAKVSAKVLCGEPLKIAVETGHLQKTAEFPNGILQVEYPPQEKTDILVSGEGERYEALITLCPKEYVIGIGCRKGKESERLNTFIEQVLQKQGIELWQIYGIASIDLKADEPAICTWSAKHRVPFFTYSCEELEKVEGCFQESDFVKQTVGVGNVCERAALNAAGKNGRLVGRKYAEDGMTIAIAKREWSVKPDET